MKKQIFVWLFEKCPQYQLRMLVALVYGIWELGGALAVLRIFRESLRDARRNRARPT